jgi:biopolymer transport protein ExbB/TolQ
MNIISNILYWISTGLLVPVIVLLILFFVRALLMIGGFFGQYLTVKRVNAKLSEQIKSLDAADLDSFAASLPAKSSSLVVDYLRQIIANKGNQARIDLLLSSYEIEADKSLSVSKTLTKMGPILGLMGTLIPMGPALVGLSTGDIASMAYNMQVAFATTVVGLVISAIGFVTQQTKERWYVRDLAMLDYVAELQKQSVA